MFRTGFGQGRGGSEWGGEDALLDLALLGLVEEDVGGWAEFVVADGVDVGLFDKFEGFAADQDGFVGPLGAECGERRPTPREQCTIGQDRMCTEENLGDLRHDVLERGDECVLAFKPVQGECVQRLLPLQEGFGVNDDDLNHKAPGLSLEQSIHNDLGVAKCEHNVPVLEVFLGRRHRLLLLVLQLFHVLENAVSDLKDAVLLLVVEAAGLVNNVLTL